MEKNKIVMSYDREADVVYISFGKPREAVSEEIDRYVVVRRDPETKEILGITITNFSSQSRVHIDPFGYVHVCQGITIGNVGQTLKSPHT